MTRHRYLIQTLGGMSMGTWEADSAQGALLAFYRKRGYKPSQVWIEDGGLVFSEDVLDIFGGNQNTWLVERLN